MDESNPFFFYRSKLNEICAVCLKSINGEHSLTDEIPNSNPVVSVLDVLKSISQFNITKGPKRVCSACFTNVKAAYKFQSICNQTQEYFDKFTEHQKAISKRKPAVDASAQESAGKKPKLKVRKRVECNICNKVVTLTYLKLHVQTHTGEKPHQCELCQKRFAEKQTLKKHMLFHNNIRKYTCTYCGRAFHLAGGLREHIRTHTGEKPYKCSYCSKSFPICHSLTRHLRQHMVENPFKCDTCSKSFPNKVLLNAHTLANCAQEETKEIVGVTGDPLSTEVIL